MDRFKTLLLSFLSIFACNLVVAQQKHLELQAVDHKTSPVLRPLTVASNEATKKQLAFAEKEGIVVDNCVRWLNQHAEWYSDKFALKSIFQIDLPVIRPSKLLR